MMNVIRHIFFFIVQYMSATLVVVIAGVAVTLYHCGMPYSHTPEFHAIFLVYLKAGLAVGALFCLILLCYHLTRKALEEPGETPWNNPDNI
jgi:hypothetical protein